MFISFVCVLSVLGWVAKGILLASTHTTTNNCVVLKQQKLFTNILGYKIEGNGYTKSLKDLKEIKFIM